MEQNMEKIRITIDGVEVNAWKGQTILESIATANVCVTGLYIPTLYYLKGINDIDDSGICVVEVEGEKELQNASEYRIFDGMTVHTKTERVRAARTKAIQAICDIHDRDCFHCHRQGSCELQALFKYPVNTGRLPEECRKPIDDSSIIVRDLNRCVRCRRCVHTCEKVQGIAAIEAVGEGLGTVIRPVSPEGLQETTCVNCGQCVEACPVGALYARDCTKEVFEAIADPKKYVVAQIAPAVRATFGEEYGFPIGGNVEKRIPAALRELGFDAVFDTKFGADLTIMEEAGEFIRRVETGGTLPMMTSCCPGWVKYCEHNFPDLLPHLSSCKSPQQMFGAIIKSYYAEKIHVAKEDIVVVSIMPCTAKKYEIKRADQCGAGVPDVDISITAREIARMLKESDVDFLACPYEEYDEPLGLGSGAGVIFGATGGVMEAALRTAVEKMSGQELPKLEFTEVRGMKGTKEAAYEVNGQTIRVAVVSGLENAKALLEKVRNREANYQFVEVMACPGGCINGGGQPHQRAYVEAREDVRSERAAVLYDIDGSSKIRKSHKNPQIKELYDTYLGAPGSELSHQLLHTTYQER